MCILDIISLRFRKQRKLGKEYCLMVAICGYDCISIVSTHTEHFIRTFFMFEHPAKPYIIKLPTKRGAEEAFRFLRKEREQLCTSIVEKGALLFRGFDVHNAEHAQEFLSLLFPNRTRNTYQGGLGYKKSYGNGIYSSTEVPFFITISPHHEMAYLPQEQQYIIFFCITPASKGGQTPLVCGESLYRAMDDNIREQFETHGICYTRTYPKSSFGSRWIPTSSHPFFVSWAQVFGSEQKEVVTQKCSDMGLESVWLPNDTLQTRVVLPAARIHSQRQTKVWYNQAHTFVPTQKYLGSLLYSTYKLFYSFQSLRQGEASFGNGDPIPHESIDRIHHLLDTEKYTFDWQRGDVLVLDNRRIMHGREPYRGARRVLTAML
jgi:hypothetical protein